MNPEDIPTQPMTLQDLFDALAEDPGAEDDAWMHGADAFQVRLPAFVYEPLYCDMDGHPIGILEWAGLFEKSERIIARSHVGRRFVSTVWIGIAPHPYETMVFYVYRSGKWTALDQVRYSTMAQARAGHERITCDVKGHARTYQAPGRRER